MRRFREMKNKGFSLVEILVTVALLTIVGGAITSFIVVTQRNYGNGVVQTDQQTKAQQIANQLEDIMIEATSITSTTSTSSPEDGDPVTVTRIEVYGNNEESHDDDFVVIWNSEFQTLTYDYLSGSEPALLAEGVSAFSVDISDLEKNNSVWFYFTLTSGDSSNAKVYSTSHKVKLRNEIMVTVEEETLPTTTESNVNLTVGPHPLYVWPGTTNALSAVVSVTEGGVTTTPMGLQSVVWIASGTVDPTTKVINSTNALTLGENERGTDSEDGIEKNVIGLTATKSLDDGTSKTASLVAHVREITNISASDSRGFAYSDLPDGHPHRGTATDWKILEGATTTISTEILGINLKDSEGNDLTFTEKGGLDVEIVDPQSVVKEYNYNRSIGSLELEVKDNLDFSGAAPTFQVKFQCHQNCFQYVTLTITYTLEEKPDVIAEIGDGTLGRTGEIDVDFSGLNMDNLEAYTEYGKTKYRFKNGQVINLYFTYHYLDGSTLTDTMGNQGTYGSFQDTNQLFQIKFVEGDPTKLTLKLKADGHAFSTPYSLGATNCYYWNNRSNVTSVDVVVDFAGYQKSKFTLYWEDVAFEYNVAAPNESEGNSRWLSATTHKNQTVAEHKANPWTDTEIVYVSPSDASSRTYSYYYMYPEGWDGTDYDIDTSRYVAISDNGLNLSSYFTINKSTYRPSNTTYYYIYSSSLSAEQQTTLRNAGVNYIDLVYEGNKFLGDSALQYSDYKALYESIKGCRGIVRFVLKDSNVHNDNHPAVSLKGAYCPRYADLAAGSSNGDYQKATGHDGYYYWVDENTRYLVYREQNSDNSYTEYAVYQTTNANTSWSNDLYLEWDDGNSTTAAGWYDKFVRNVYNYFSNPSVAPSPAYCPTYNELKNMGYTRWQYTNSNTTFYEYFTSVNNYVFWVDSYRGNEVPKAKYGSLYNNGSNLDTKVTYYYLDNPNGTKAWYDFSSNNFRVSDFNNKTIKPSIYFCPSYVDCYYGEYNGYVERHYSYSTGYYYYYYFDSNGRSNSTNATEMFDIYWSNDNYYCKYYRRVNGDWQSVYTFKWKNSQWQMTN